MKCISFILLLTTIVTFNSYAQKNEPKIVLTKGQKIVVKTTSTQEADMGMGMEMKNFTTAQNDLYVLDAGDVNYTLTNTLTGLKLSMDMMGQTSTYDSDKKEDSASVIGKSVSNLNVPDTITLNKYSRLVTATKKVEAAAEEANPMESMFESFGNSNDNIVKEAFFIVPAGKKTGDKWVDSSSTKDTKIYKEYQLQSIENGIITILENGKVDNNTQTEIQGMQVTINMTAKSTGEIKVNSKTSLVNKRDVKTELTGNLEMMGQQVPVTGKGTISTVYEY